MHITDTTGSPSFHYIDKNILLFEFFFLTFLFLFDRLILQSWRWRWRVHGMPIPQKYAYLLNCTVQYRTLPWRPVYMITMKKVRWVIRNWLLWDSPKVVESYPTRVTRIFYLFLLWPLILSISLSPSPSHLMYKFISHSPLISTYVMLH